MLKYAWLVMLLVLVGCGKKEDSCCCTQTTTSVERSKDLICNMWVNKTDKAIKTEFDNADYYFCAEDCKKQFLANPTKYTRICDCKKFKHDCQCEHCAGKRTPCDCK